MGTLSENLEVVNDCPETMSKIPTYIGIYPRS